MNSTIKKIERLVKENIGVNEAVLVYAALTRINPNLLEKDFGTHFSEELVKIQKEHNQSLFNHAVIANFVRDYPESICPVDELVEKFGENWANKALDNSTVVYCENNRFFTLGKAYK